MRYHSKEVKQEAVRLVKFDGYTPTKAAKLLGIPRSTLQEFVAGRSTHERAGTDTILNKIEETALLNVVLDMARQGMPLSRKNVKKIVREIISHPNNPKPCILNVNMETGPSDEWLRKLFKRYPEMEKHLGETKENDDCLVFVDRNSSDETVKVDVVKINY